MHYVAERSSGQMTVEDAERCLSSVSDVFIRKWKLSQDALLEFSIAYLGLLFYARHLNEYSFNYLLHKALAFSGRVFTSGGVPLREPEIFSGLEEVRSALATSGMGRYGRTSLLVLTVLPLLVKEERVLPGFFGSLLDKIHLLEPRPENDTSGENGGGQTLH